MHPYTEKPGDLVKEQFYANGVLQFYRVVNNGKPANGWSSKTWYQNAVLQQEENFSNGLLIEKISYDKSGVITEHKIWNNRLKLLFDKKVQQMIPKPNVVTGYAFLHDFIKQLPTISVLIGADYQEASLLRSHNDFRKEQLEEAAWTLPGEQGSFYISWSIDEINHQWHCHCKTEAAYLKMKAYLSNKF